MLNIQSISKTFNPGTVNAKQALSGLSLHLNHGDFVTIIGSNGAGKSTLFNAIAGSFYVDDGFIELDGEDITYMPEHKRSLMVGRLFQDPLKGTAPGMKKILPSPICGLQRGNLHFPAFPRKIKMRSANASPS